MIYAAISRVIGIIAEKANMSKYVFFSKTILSYPNKVHLNQVFPSRYGTKTFVLFLLVFA